MYTYDVQLIFSAAMHTYDVQLIFSVAMHTYDVQLIFSGAPYNIDLCTMKYHIALNWFSMFNSNVVSTVPRGKFGIFVPYTNTELSL